MTGELCTEQNIKMKQIANLTKLLVSSLALVGSLSVEGQILHYRFTGTIEGDHPDLDFFTEELVFSDMSVKRGDKVSGTITVDPVGGITINGGGLSPGNRFYSGTFSDYEVEINGEPFIRDDERSTLEVAVFNNMVDRPDWYEFPLGNERADGVIFVSFVPVSRIGEELLDPNPEQFIFSLNLTDTSASALRRASYPGTIDLEDYDLARGFIRPHVPFELADYGAMFQIDSFELIETRVRAVIAEGPKSQTVAAGDSIRLTMAEVGGNEGVECQWSFNGVDLPGETLPGLTLNDLQPSQAGTYRVTAWNNFGTTNVASARLVVEGLRHRLNPLDLDGWNADVIVAPGEHPDEQVPFDPDSAYWFAADYQEQPDGLPGSGEFTSAVNTSIRYQLQAYEAKNMLLLAEADAGSIGRSDSSSPSGRLVLQRPKKLTSLALIAASVGGSVDDSGSLILHFDDGSRSEVFDFNAGDWWTVAERSGAAAIAGLGRLKGTSDAELEHDSPSGFGFGLYETEIELISKGLADKSIASIEFQKPASAVATGVFAVSGQAAALQRGYHVSWPQEGDKELFEVATSLEGPWLRPTSEGHVVSNRHIKTVDTLGLPRYSRSLLRSLDQNLYTHYDFYRDGRDRLEVGISIEAEQKAEFVGGSLFLPKETKGPSSVSSSIEAGVPRLNYVRYTLALDFFPLEVSPSGEQVIVNGGRSNRWLQLYSDRGRLALALDNGQVVEVFENAEVMPNEWHRVICAFDTLTGIADVMLDGRQLPPLDLGERYRYQVNGTLAPISERALNFAGSDDAKAFVGYLDNLMVFRRGLSQESMAQLHAALEPSLLTIDLGTSGLLGDGFSVGMNLVWESNLEGFELQESESITGPWSQVEPLEDLFNERILFPMQMDSEQAIYRLHRR